MVVVLIILGIIIALFAWLMLIVFSTLRIKIEKFEISNILHPNVIHDYTINIGFYFLNNIKVLGFNINKSKLEHSEIFHKINFQDVEKTVELDKDLLNNLKKIKPTLESLNLKLDIGTEDAVLTSIIIFTTSTILSIGFPHIVKPKNYKDIYYEITPLYKGKNLFNLSLNCIISVKMLHIMSIIYIYLQKMREENYERTSNRRAYANSYE